MGRSKNAGAEKFTIVILDQATGEVAKEITNVECIRYCNPADGKELAALGYNMNGGQLQRVEMSDNQKLEIRRGNA